MKRLTLRVSLICALASLAGAQTFDAASIKPGSSGKFGMHGGPGTSDPGRITYWNTSLKDLLAKAYGVEPYQVSGPEWLGSSLFDVIATVPAGSTKDEVREMLRQLLAER